MSPVELDPQSVRRAIWLDGVAFDHGAMLGTPTRARPESLTKRTGWSAVRRDQDGSFYDALTGATVRYAVAARVADGRVQAFGGSATPLPQRSSPVYGPCRRSYFGDLGHLNFEIASKKETAEAIAWVLRDHPGCTIVDGSDDWNAPLYARPEELCRRYGIRPAAYWHTGKSGISCSGVVLPRRAYAAFCRAYRREFGFGPERCPGEVWPLWRPECGCYSGDALRLYGR